MKQIILLVAVLYTTASAGLAMGCGCSSEKVRLAPVREQILVRSECSLRQPVIANHTAFVPECPSCYWVPPSTSDTAYVVGNVLTAPFRLLTGRSLGQPDVVSSYNYTEPVGEKITTLTTHSKIHVNKCGQVIKKVTVRSDTMLAPVGERLTTVKVIRTKPMLMPVSERITSCPCNEPIVQPVGERIIRSVPACAAPACGAPACAAPACGACSSWSDY